MAALPITIVSGEVRIGAILDDTPCAQKIYDSLPIESAINVWGREIYFSIDVQCRLDATARRRMAIGEIAYWPPGTAFCVFFGQTPASGPDGNPCAASDVNVVGRVVGDPGALAHLCDGQPIRIERALS
jgi:hypothetical protein